MDTAIYWVEYVVRHKGAGHLKVAGIRFPWYKYHSLDVIGFVAVVVSLVVYVLCVGVRKILRCCGICGKAKSKSKKD